MIRFASFSTNKLTQSHMLATQTRLFESQMQIVSGKVSRDYAGVAIDSRRLVNLENAVSEVTGFIKNINVTESRLQLMESTVAGAFDVATRIRDLLVNALNIDNASILTLNQRAEDMLQELTGALNIKQDNRFLFSGSRIDSAPIDKKGLYGQPWTRPGKGLVVIERGCMSRVDYFVYHCERYDPVSGQRQPSGQLRAATAVWR